MSGMELSAGGASCRVYGEKNASFLLIQPVDDHDLAELDAEVRYIGEHAAVPFLLAAVPVENWNDDLSPWPAPPVFGNQPFGGGAEETLRKIQDKVIPALRSEFSLPKDVRLILGGYSLAALFALWAVCQTHRFSAAAAASPSVWFQNWISYASSHAVQTNHVYLSLGDREEKTRNQQMAKVKDCIIETHAVLRKNTDCTLEWNEGNHFKDPDKRICKALLWCINRIKMNETEV